MSPSLKSRFVILVILDGWGLAAKGPGNAISAAKTPNIDKYWASYPHTQLTASGQSVGLPRGEPGNTEVGHLNLGAGRIVYQDLTRINMSIADGSFFTNDVLQGAIDHAQKNKSNLHYMGLVGAGGVHSSIEHLYALIQLAAKSKFDRLFLHIFTDGRDSPPQGALTYLNGLEGVLESERVGKIATIMGRYWAMDRDRRWERTEKAYLALTKGIGDKAANIKDAIKNSYAKGKTDEFIEPTVIEENGKAVGLIGDNDSVVFYNFRVDRPRQLTRAFVAKDFLKSANIWDYDPYLVKRKGTHQQGTEGLKSKIFERGDPLKNLFFVTMTLYDRHMLEEGAHVAFPPERVILPLGRVISEAGLRQLRVAESEKERFVTSYFDGLKDITYPSEDRIIVPSPKVSTYDQKPEMAAYDITDALINKFKADPDYSFILINYANVDMVGHTGNIRAAIRACEVVDECLGKLVNMANAYEGFVLITADHGNTEEMINISTGKPDTEHSSNPVPFIAVAPNLLENAGFIQTGILADVAPTVLSILGLPVADTMTGRNLLEGI